MTDETTSKPAAQLMAGASTREAANLAMWQALFIAIVIGLFTIVWLTMYTQINSLIWENDFVAANRCTIPAGAIFFSLLVGLAIKYFHAPNLIGGKGAIESLKDGDFSGNKTFWGALFSSFFSLFSGASVGPEGSISFLDVDICEKLALKLKLAKESFLPASLVGLSSAYNGVVGNPAFAALFATETSGGKGGLSLLATNLAAGVVGFLLFVLLGVQSFAGLLALPPIDTIKINWVLWAIALGLLGALLQLMWPLPLVRRTRSWEPLVTLVLKAPLTSILLVSVVANGDSNLNALIVVASVAAMVVGQAFQKLKDQRGPKADKAA